MATWQFDVLLIRRGAPIPQLSDDGYIAEPLAEDVSSDARQYLVERFGQPREMLPDFFLFGVEEGSRVDFAFESERSASLKVRIDARSDTAGFIATVCELAERLGCVFFVFESKDVLEPNPAALAKALANSRAAAFVRNPRRFLDELPSAS